MSSQKKKNSDRVNQEVFDTRYTKYLYKDLMGQKKST